MTPPKALEILDFKTYPQPLVTMNKIGLFSAFCSSMSYDIWLMSDIICMLSKVVNSLLFVKYFNTILPYSLLSPFILHHLSLSYNIPHHSSSFPIILQHSLLFHIIRQHSPSFIIFRQHISYFDILRHYSPSFSLFL